MVTYLTIYMIVISTITTICAISLFVHVRKIYVTHSDRLDVIDGALQDIGIDMAHLSVSTETLEDKIVALESKGKALKAGKQTPDQRVPYQ